MKEISIFKDKFVNRNIVFTILSILALFGGCIFYMNNMLNMYQKEEIIRYANVIGSLEMNDIDKDDISSYILNPNLNDDYIKKGFEELNKYGYFEDIKINNKWIGTSFNGVKHTMIGIGITFVILTIIILYIAIYNILKKVNKVSHALEGLSHGKEFIELESKDEGAISLLYHHYNMTSSRMHGWIDELNLERNSIKELLNDLSHQLKTPIASIKMNTELILDGYTDEKETKEFLINNSENIERMQWITEGLLQLSKLETHSIDLHKQQKDLKNTLIGAIKSTLGKAGTKNIQISVSNMDEGIIYHDERWTKESIINIIDNAIKYSPNDSEIYISMINYDWKSEIIIKDNGYGIEKKDIDSIFKRFYRSYDERVQQEEGSGIGLYLSKKIIEDQNGTIKVESEVNKGSMFIITFYKHIVD